MLSIPVINRRVTAETRDAYLADFLVPDYFAGFTLS